MCEDIKVLEMVMVIVTLWMYLMPLNYTFKNGYNGMFYVYFTTIKKKTRKMWLIFKEKKQKQNPILRWPRFEICRHFEAVLIILVNDIKENIATMNEKIRNPSREVETKMESNGSSRTEKYRPEKSPSCL